MVPVGTGASEKAVLAMETLGVTALHSTPSYARYLAERLRAAGRDPREFGLRKIFVGGEPGGDREALGRELEALIRTRLSVRAAVTLVPPGSLERSEMKSRLTRLAG